MGSSTEGPVFTHQDGGKGECFFFWGGGGSSCQRNRRQQSIKGELYKIDCKLTANDGVEGGGGHKWGHNYYLNQPKYFNPNTLLPLVDK